MAGRKITEIFKRYVPSEKYISILNSAENVTVRADKERKLAEIRAEFPELIDKSDLYGIEDEIREQYDLNVVRILPLYPKNLFSSHYMRQIFLETNRIGMVAKGFFNNYEVDISDNVIEIRLPFIRGGIDLLDVAKTNAVISGIIRSEFGLEYEVRIDQTDDWEQQTEEFYNSYRSELNGYNAEISEMIREYEASNVRSSKNDNSEPVEEEKIVFPRVTTLNPDAEAVEIKSDTEIRVGNMTFDISSPTPISGEIFDLSSPTPLRDTGKPLRNIVIFGEVFEITSRETRKGDKVSVNIGVTDGDNSIYVKNIMTPDVFSELMEMIKPGIVLALRGSVKADKFDEQEMLFSYTDIVKIKRAKRKDNAPEKRVELHAHTTMSAMDATITPEQLVETAHAWGHKAVAITDHGNLQAYPNAMIKAEKLGDIKVIYGLEAYFVDDTARAVYGQLRPDFDDEFVVFDIETTGLSPLNCHITEIGAVLIQKGEVKAEFETFVNPKSPIPENIVKLTGITDEMVADAPSLEEVLPKFLEFAGNRLLIAHNAGFDISFIRRGCEICHLKFDNSYLDTVALSRYLNPDLKNHKLDTIAEYFNLGDFNHHRASDDAKMLAAIFFCMTDKLGREGITGTEAMLEAMAEHADPLKLPTYHQILLVKNKVGLKNLYRLVSSSYLNYFRKHPRIPKTVLSEYREGIIVGSACESGELFQAILANKPESELLEIAEFYDYLEIQPICNNRFLIERGDVADEDGLRELNKKVIELGKKAGKPVVATCDAHFMDDEDEIFRKILLASMKFKDADRDIHLYFRTTEEMLKEFDYLDEKTAHEIVIENPNKIADMIEPVLPIPKGNYPPHIDGAEEELTEMCWSKAKRMYGDPLPDIVHDRLKKELDSIIKNGFAVLYIIAQKLVENSEKAGYLVGSRGSVGSSFVAIMASISRVNPLPPHYRCPKCKYNKFFTEGEIGSGFDLEDKKCPVCGENLNHDGHDIPFETFLGFYGDKSPDIDLNFSGDVQADAHKFTEVLFGKGNAFRAGTLGTLAPKTAYGFTAKYLDEHKISVSRAHQSYLMSKCVGVKRTTGQHPGGIIVVPREYDVYDFTPVQHPADDPNSDTVTTHFAFKYLHDTILKLDILGHDIPTKFKRVEEYTGTSVLDVPMNDKKVLSLFTSTEALGVTPEQIYSETGTFGLPEMGSRFVRQVLIDAQPKTFSDLLQISGLTHGTNVWLNNAQLLIKEKICDISEVIGTRDDIMLYLIHHGLEKSMAFKIMEDVRKGKGLKPEYEEAMIKENIPSWYMDSCKKIKYMFPKAHAAAYVTDAITLGWYKVYYPLEFYAAYFTAAPAGFDSEIVMGGRNKVAQTITEISKKGTEASQKENELLDAMLLVNEYYCRGYTFLPVDLMKSASHAFLPENGKIRLPFASLPGLGDTAAEKIVKARESGEIYCVDDLQRMAQLSKTVIEILDRNGVLNGMAQTNQLSIF